jgi:predicted RNA binding protein YcfA (HicA-like mRNA interferase family)
MKLPRGVSGDRLVRALEHLGYEVVRQKGSHVRLRHNGPPAHLVTVPLHNPLKIGTLHGILSEVGHMRSIDLESLAELL